MSLLKTEYFPSALSVLINSLEVLHITNGDFLSDNCLKCAHGKCAQTLLKCQGQRSYHIYWSVLTHGSSKKNLLVICKISRPFINTLIADGKYSLFNRDNLMEPIQMQLSRKQQSFSDFFAAFLKSSWNFGHFLKKVDPHCWCSSEITDPEKPC